MASIRRYPRGYSGVADRLPKGRPAVLCAKRWLGRPLARRRQDETTNQGARRASTSTTRPIILFVELRHVVCMNIYPVHACRPPAPSVVSFASFPLRRFLCATRRPMKQSASATVHTLHAAPVRRYTPCTASGPKLQSLGLRDERRFWASDGVPHPQLR